jgi:hypothetical protein
MGTGPGVPCLALFLDFPFAAFLGFDDRRRRLHQPLVRRPLLGMGLLVEVHAHDVRAAQLTRDPDELHPAGMVAQDVPDHQLALQPLGGRDYALGIFHGRSQRLFDEDMRPASSP